MKNTIKLPNIYGQGALFAFSGFDGECNYYKSLTGTLMGDCLGIQFRNLKNSSDRAYFIVRPKDVFNIYYNAVTSDMICAEIEGNDRRIYNLDIVFVNQNTIVMKSNAPADAKILFDYDVTESKDGNVSLYDGNGNKFALAKKVNSEGIAAAISYGECAEDNALSSLNTDIDEIINKRIEFFEKLPAPKFKDEAEERLYYKCASILRSTIYTPTGKMTHIALTPDRFPHRGVWLWDTAYLIIGMKYLSVDIAKEAVLAILECSRPDGFLPHMTTPDRQSDITQPPVLAWAALEIYKKTGDKEFLSSAFERLSAYIEWDIKNRDENGNGLLEWLVNPLDPFCKCDESGMDNTPRFDEAEEMDCIDFSAFLASDMRCLSEIAGILGKEEEHKLWLSRFNFVKDKINTVLWDDEDCFYYDKKLSDGKFHKVKSVASFIPLFAGVCDKMQAAKMVEHLKNPSEFGTAFPIPTVSADDKTYPTMDMFRGTVWLNFNYLVARGLEDYGYNNEAEELKRKTIETIKYWYQNDGVVYEFYDSKNEVTPARLSRKGPALQPYMPEIRLQSVRDFSWGASAVIDFLMGK